jgi:amino acid permease
MDAKIGKLVMILVMVLVAAVLFPTIQTKVTNLTDSTGPNYVGDDASGIVSLIPVFYWLLVGLTVIFAAVAGMRETD